MSHSRLALLVLAIVSLAACGDDEGTGFTVSAKVRGMNIQAISQIQYRFESTGNARFDTDSGSRSGVSYATTDGGRVFSATANSAWVIDAYQKTGSEFVFPMPFVNPDGSGDTELRVLIDREIEGAMVRAGESAPQTAKLPAAAGSSIDVVVGCIENGPCGLNPPGPDTDGGLDAGIDSGIDSGVDSGVDAGVDSGPLNDSGV